MRVMIIRIEIDNKQIQWKAWNDPRGWILETHDEYVRVLDKTWTTSAHKINLIAENYGAILLQEVS